MNCPSCKRPNADGLEHCDFCGTPLSGAPAQKRKTEAEAPARPAGGKRVTEIEPAQGPQARGADPGDQFDPFRPSFRPLERQDAGAGSGRAQKGRTSFAAGGGVSDPFSPSPQPGLRGERPLVPETGRPKEPTPGRRIVGWMITFDGAPDGSSFVLREGRNTIGRDPDCDVILDEHSDESGVSRLHAYIIWRNGRARVADSNTMNGTFLNDEDVLGQVEVSDNDVVRVGQFRLLVRLLDPQKVATVWKPPAPGT